MATLHLVSGATLNRWRDAIRSAALHPGAGLVANVSDTRTLARADAATVAGGGGSTPPRIRHRSGGLYLLQASSIKDIERRIREAAAQPGEGLRVSITADGRRILHRA